jgi:3-oxoacyl-[acyl-carrier protein] reductase
MNRDLAGRVAVITGAGGGTDGGIGAGIARVLAASGATIAVNDVVLDAAEDTVAELVASGASARAFVGDISDSAAATGLIDSVASHYGQIDILVNNAGIVGVHTLDQTSDDEWQRVVGVNLNGPFYVTRAAIPHLKRSDCGRVVFISSIAGIRIGQLGGAVYTATKEALLGLARHLAAEVGHCGITSNAVLPGLVMTPLVGRRTSPETKAELVASVPSRRAASPDEIGEVVAFLSSECAGYINGAAIVVDGGKTVLQGDFSSWARVAGMAITEDS